MKTAAAILAKFRRTMNNYQSEVTLYRASGSSGFYRTYAEGETLNASWKVSRGTYVIGEDGEDVEVRVKMKLDPAVSLSRHDLIDINGRVMEIVGLDYDNIKGTQISWLVSLADIVLPDDVTLT